MSAALQASGLGKRYGSNWALRDCSLDVPAGSVTALVGPNGAGKTTLLQLAVGLSAPSAGELAVLGRSPASEAAELLPRVGFVAQDHPLHRGFTRRRHAELRAAAQPGLGRRPGAPRGSTARPALGQKVGSCPAASRPRWR